MTTQEPSPSSSIHPAPRPPRRAGPTNKDTTHPHVDAILHHPARLRYLLPNRRRVLRRHPPSCSPTPTSSCCSASSSASWSSPSSSSRTNSHDSLPHLQLRSTRTPTLTWRQRRRLPSPRSTRTHHRRPPRLPRSQPDPSNRRPCPRLPDSRPRHGTHYPQHSLHSQEGPPHQNLIVKRPNPLDNQNHGVVCRSHQDFEKGISHDRVRAHELR